MAAWAAAARAEETAAPPRTRPRVAKRERRVTGGVFWIGVVAVLLAGVVAMNVAVLRLNMKLDRLGRERADLRAENAALSVQLSSAASAPRIQGLAAKRLGYVQATPDQTSYLTLPHYGGTAVNRRVNRRIRLLLAALTLAFAGLLLRATWLQSVRAESLSRLGQTQHRETVALPAGRGTIYDRAGVELGLGERATTVYANPKQIVNPRAAAVAVERTLGLDADHIYPEL